jgi:DNA-binding GntR family transcriptional regulator
MQGKLVNRNYTPSSTKAIGDRKPASMPGILPGPRGEHLEENPDPRAAQGGASGGGACPCGGAPRAVAPRAARAARPVPLSRGRVVLAGRAAAAGARRARTGPAADAAPDAATPSARRSEAMVHDALLKALLGGALRPGTALRERHLAETFGATRGTVRKVLLRLGQEGKLELRPNRGAYVPQPTADDVRRVYEQRKVLECGIVGVLAERIGSVARERLAALDALLAAERRAQRAGRRDEAVRLAGDFHLVLVDLYDNPELSRSLRALVARTQLFVALFESAEAGACSVDEHDAIVRALRRRDAASAIRAMVGHLDHVERRVLARMPGARDMDVGAILRAAMT